LQKSITFTYSDPEGILEKIKTLTQPQQKSLSFKRGKNPADQKKKPQYIDMRAVTSRSQCETSG